MKRKRLTQVFPFLLPIRKWQRKKLFYLEMLIDGNKYAKNKSEALLLRTPLCKISSTGEIEQRFRLN